MKPQATARAAQHDGEIEVPGGVGGMLVVTLDNNNSMFSNTVVACEARRARPCSLPTSPSSPPHTSLAPPKVVPETPPQLTRPSPNPNPP